MLESATEDEQCGRGADDAKLQLCARDLKRAFERERAYARDLVAANARLGRLDRLKVDFLAFVYHELRTPLTHLSGVDMLDPLGDPAEQAEVIAILRNGHERLKALIRKAAEFFKWSSVERVDVSLPVDLGQLVREVVADIPALHAPDVVFSIRADAGPHLVGGSRTDLFDMIRVLLDNAIKFSPTLKSITVDLAGRPEVSVIVTDRGVGLPSDMADELFQPFTIADVAFMSHGTGLSLAIAKAIVRAHGGRIHARSGGSGGGAEFSVELPVFDPARSQAARLAIPVPLLDGGRLRHAQPSGGEHRRQGERAGSNAETPSQRPVEVQYETTILIADDDRSLRELIHTTLQDPRRRILEVSSGVAAIEVARWERPDLLVLDWTMPGMTGIDVIRALRHDPATAMIPILMLTGRGSGKDREFVNSLGVQAFLMKPFSPLKLLAKVQEILQRTGTNATSVEAIAPSIDEHAPVVPELEPGSGADHKQLAYYMRDLESAMEAELQSSGELADANARLEALDHLRTDFVLFISQQLRVQLGAISIVDLLDPQGNVKEQAAAIEALRSAYSNLHRFVSKGLKYFEWLASERSDTADAASLLATAKPVSRQSLRPL